MVDFLSPEDRGYEIDSLLGEQAFHIKNSQDWAWIKKNILDAIFDEAVKCMRISRTDDQRARAQAMLIAHDEVISKLDYLINKGDAARAALKQQRVNDPKEETYA